MRTTECPLGKSVIYSFLFLNCFNIALEYGRNTFLLLALGYGVFDNHQTVFTELVTRILLIFVQMAGEGNFVGLL